MKMKIDMFLMIYYYQNKAQQRVMRGGRKLCYVLLQDLSGIQDHQDHK